MPNIASALKAEMSRIARKELRGEISSLKSMLGASRSQIADLKRRIQSLEQQVRRLAKSRPAAAAAVEIADDSAAGLRFSAKGLASQRRRLGLSAEEFGRLLGVSGQSIYKWEDGRARPRARYLPAIAQLRTMGKRQSAAALAAVESASG